MAVDPASDIVLVHDAARPLISETVIQNVINEVHDIWFSCFVPFL